MSFGYCIDCEYCRVCGLGSQAREAKEMEKVSFVCMRHPPSVIDEGRNASPRFWGIYPIFPSNKCLETCGCGEFEQAKKTRTGTGA